MFGLGGGDDDVQEREVVGCELSVQVSETAGKGLDFVCVSRYNHL